jgi:hypothetical protein
VAGEFIDQASKERLWELAAASIQPNFDRETGEFTLGFGLDEPHPRGQWNARAMAGWVCTQGAWSDLFNKPNLSKFEEPTVIDVDFPQVALSEARWDGSALHLAVQACNASSEGARTRMKLTNIDTTEGWTIRFPSGETAALNVSDKDLHIELIADNLPVTIARGQS